MRHWHLPLFALLTFTLASCGTSERSQSGPLADSQSAPDEQPAETPQPAAPITTSVESIAQLDQRIASHPGKVVVVDLWALW